MKKVVLVDDEILTREMIRDTVQWEKEGFQYCGDASDGEMALPLIEKIQPDLVITDIKMPFMDGLELCEVVRRRFPAVKLMILSGFGEFEYARKALRMGVEEYCLKPVTAGDLTALLQKIGARIDKEKEAKKQLEELKQLEDQQESGALSKLLRDLCCGFITTSEAVHLSAALSLDLLASYYAVFLTDNRNGQSGVSECEPALQQIQGFLSRIAPASPPLSFQLSRTKTVWIWKGSTAAGIRKELEQLHSFLSLEEKNPLLEGVYWGTGSIQERLQGVHLSFLEAEEDLHLRRLIRKNREDLLKARGQLLTPTLFVDRKGFMEFLRMGSPTHTDQQVRQYASGLLSLEWQHNVMGAYLLHDLTLEVFRTARESFRNPDLHEEALNRLQQSIDRVRSGEDALEYLIRLAEQYWHWRTASADRYGDLIQKVKEYIHHNYDKDHLSLQEAADHVRLSSTHLSKIFSQETGATFIEYVTQTRMRKAMELLQGTALKSYEVAFQVGYNDPHYFSNLFKRFTGMTAREFRKRGATGSYPIETSDPTIL